MTTADRRQFLQSAALGAPLLLGGMEAAAAQGMSEPHGLKPNSIIPADLPKLFDVDVSIHNLENGYWGIMPRVVAQEYQRQSAFINETNSIWARNVLPGGACLAAGGREAREAIARQVGCSVDEIAITQSGAQAIDTLILNYRPLKAGDAVICCDLDYDAMISAVEWLGSRRGAQVVKFSMPEPATAANILAAYEDVLKRTPNAKLMVVTQVSNRTGLVTPVREIVAMARARGVDTVVDAAHGVACLDFQISDLGADFVGWSVHKWTSAPLGTGAFYIRKSRLVDIDVAATHRDADPADITSRLPSATVNFAAVLAIPKAVEFHFAIGAAAKEKHLRTLRNRWVDALRDVPNVEICVPDDPARYCTMTSFRLKGMDSDAKAQAVQARLFEKYKILTVWRKGVAKAPVIRVTPGLYTRTEDVDALARALRVEHAMYV
ncbi:aminotransferase class V-fold PLP-dependent enzyme [Novosphingobium sp. KACC 22771]|uniref:aminotransferase class V-fold PLP-dependent enzyme n=1 Tax=Novosphingobium sp. KACC 22771 TaxID=3025670 RepID=UPI002365EB1E|nr:aminotransferase class V-fold PLP-dependent enzyme [Novosphingobium sp. KACC 22771]WDF70935.1 aminotransferase class V-fold PLP-dependent enzyme [Novosphingobium sp. KACC 22771]